MTRSPSSSWIQRDALVDLLLREVAQDDRNLEPAQEEERKLARHEPCADDPDALHAARLGVGHAHTPLRPALDQVEGIDRGLGLRAGQKVRECVLLRAIALLERPRCGAFDEVERAIRSGRGAVQLAVEARASLATDLGDVGEISRGASLAAAFLDLLEKVGERVVEELDRLEERVGIAALERLPGVQHAILA